MIQKELDLLEAAFSSEIDSALSGTPDVFQTSKKKLAQQLVRDGYLAEHSVTLGGRLPITISGYRLTGLGRLAYCTSDRANGETEAV